MGQRIKTEALFHDFTALIPQDGSVETVQDYTLLPDDNLRIGNAAPLTRSYLRIERFDRNDPLANPPLNLWKGLFLRIPVGNTSRDAVYNYRHIKRVVGNIVELESSLNGDPVPGHTGVRIVTGYAQHYIDMRIFDLWEKGKLQISNGRYLRV